MMKKTVSGLLKLCASALASLVMLSVFALFYHNPPKSAVQLDYITNNKFVPGSNWSYMEEGFGYGKIDALGYNNGYYDNCTNPDIVFMGSSHLESLQVPYDSNCVNLLNQMFDADDLAYNDFKCLNLGASGHFFEVSASNIEYVVKKFKDSKYVVIETSDVRFSPSVLDNMLEGKYHNPVKEPGTLYQVAQKIPYFRLLYKKINEISVVKDGGNDSANDGSSTSGDVFDADVYKEKLNMVLDKILTLTKEEGITPVILMHERFYIDEDGEVCMEKEEEYKEMFKKCCENKGIKIIDCVDKMIENYNKNFELSYGFSNTVPGKGHLNKTGHRIIAEELYKQFNEMAVK